MNDTPTAPPGAPSSSVARDNYRFAGRLIVFMLVGAAVGALVGTMAGIAPFAALVGASLGMAGAVLAGDVPA